MYEGLKDIDVAGASTDFLFSVATNKRKLETLVKDLQSTIEHSAKFIEFDAERRELINEFAAKDDNGNPQVESVNSEQIVKIADPEAFGKKNDALLKKYDKEIQERTKQVADYTEYLEKESKFKPMLIDLKSVPKKGLTQKAVDGLLFMIKK